MLNVAVIHGEGLCKPLPLNLSGRIPIGYSWLAFFYSVFLLTVVSQPGSWLAAIMRWRFLGWLGGISYCVYLLHDAFNYFAHSILLHAEPQLYNRGQLAVSVFTFAVTLGVASLSWRFFEKPLILRGHYYSYEERPAESRPKPSA